MWEDVYGYKTDSVFRGYKITSSGDLREAARRVDPYVIDRLSQTLLKVEGNQDSKPTPERVVLQ